MACEGCVGSHSAGGDEEKMCVDALISFTVSISMAVEREKWNVLWCWDLHTRWKSVMEAVVASRVEISVSGATTSSDVACAMMRNVHLRR